MEGYNGTIDYGSIGSGRPSADPLFEGQIGTELDGDFDPIELLKSPLFGGQSDQNVATLGGVRTDSNSAYRQNPQYNGVGSQQLDALHGTPSQVASHFNGFPQSRGPDSENSVNNFSQQNRTNYNVQETTATSQFQNGSDNQFVGGNMHGNLQQQINDISNQIQGSVQMNQIQGGNIQVNQMQNQMQSGNLQVNAVQAGNMHNTPGEAVNRLNMSMSTLNVGSSSNNSNMINNSMSTSYSNGLTGQFNQSFQAGGTFQDNSLQVNPRGAPTVAQLSASLQTRNQASPGQEPDPAQLSEAMEKLCESMRRSAMSRNLVKQLSGRSLTKQGSSRSLPRQNSGMALRKQHSLKNLTADGDGIISASGTPIRTVPIRRLSDAKHRIQREALARAAPGSRGVFRNSSMGTPNNQGNAPNGGRTAPRTFLQLDDNSLGAF